MNKKTWAAALLISVFAAGLALTGCGGNDAGESGSSGKITVSGSSALLPLAKDAAKKFKAKNDQVSITLNAGGSGTGLKQVSEGSVDIGNSDVFAKEKLPEAKAAELVDYKVAVTVMAPVVSKEIGTNVKSLTKAQLQDIFTGKVTNWKDVGGLDEAVVLITRPSTSGTRALFTKYALDGKEELSNKSMETDDSGTLVQTVSQTKGAIGYVALSYLMNNNTVTPLAIDGVEPILDNVYNGKYPVWGYEHMYTKGEAAGAVKAFIDFIMSKDYSADIEKQGYGVASKMKVTWE